MATLNYSLNKSSYINMYDICTEFTCCRMTVERFRSRALNWQVPKRDWVACDVCRIAPHSHLPSLEALTNR